jgi:2-dehydropantoate 2-reductase
MPELVSDDPARIGPVDICLFTVKGQDTAAAAAAMGPMIGPDTRILSFQNGLAGVEALADAFGAQRVLAGVTYVPAAVEAPGVVRHTGAQSRFVFGPFTPGAGAPADAAFAEAGRAAGLEMVHLADPMPEIWAKFVMLTPFHLICGMTRSPLGAWIDVAETRALYRVGMEEVAAIARARGVVLPDGLVARNMAFSVDTADRRTRASMLDDLERGRPLELEATVGWLVRQARALGVAAPFHEMGRAVLLPHVGGGAQTA